MNAISRRSFLVGSGATVLGLSLSRFSFAQAPAASAEAAAPKAPYRGYQDVYRQLWRWDEIKRSTHECNCTNACPWTLYVRDGIVLREEQTANLEQSVPGLPDFNPLGCQKGACYSHQMYTEGRVRYPMKRVGERGSGQWKRISWDEALTEIATQLVQIIRDDGHDTVMTFAATHGSGFGKTGVAKSRFAQITGGVFVEPFGDIGDDYPGAKATTGHLMFDGGSDTRMYSKCIIHWIFNPIMTRIPDSHFINEARYNGATVISISPDLNPSHRMASLWVNPRTGTDTALALAMAHIVVRDKLTDTAHMKEQTDLPFLVRDDTNKFLRGADLEADGGEDVFYVWDTRTRQVVAAPGTEGSPQRSLLLGDIDPALEGDWEVLLRDGRSVRVRTVFERLKRVLAENTPEFASQVTGVGVEAIERIAREYGTSKPALISWNWGMGKLYYGPNLERAIILLSALTGNTGKVGGGYWGGGIQSHEGTRAAFQNGAAPFRVIPGAPWLYVHGGLREFESRWVPTPGDKTGDAYIMESIQKGWMPVFPPPGKDPRALIECGSNLLRRTRGNQQLRKYLWPKLKLVLTIDFRMNSTAMYSDYVLPAAGYYETNGIKYSDTKSPYHVFKGKAVEPVAEALDQWDIYARLCKKMQEIAPKLGRTKYRDELFGVDHDLARIYDDFTENGKWSEDVDDRVFLKAFMKDSTAFKDVSLEKLEEAGSVPWDNAGAKAAVTSDYEHGKPFTPCTNHTEKKMPWKTLTGRQQFYIDHDWFLEFGEELPVHRDPPKQGGDYPLRLTCGHARWSIHSLWRDNPLMLQLQRGEPVLYMSPKDAEARGIRDNEVVHAFNDVGSYNVRVLLTPSMQPGQVHTYHAWEMFQFNGSGSQASVSASQLNPLSMVGNYGQLSFARTLYGPNNNDKGTTLEVRKLPAEAAGA